MSVQPRVQACLGQRAVCRLSERRRTLCAGVFAAVLVVLTVTSIRVHRAGSTAGELATRTFTFTYAVEIPPLPSGTGPLNYFIYPHVEAAGQRLDRVRTRFHYAKSHAGS